MASTMQLEFNKAMSDFKKMFPDIDHEVIEAVLRANQGAVDQTIDQLLAMSTDNQNEKLRNELDGGGAAATQDSSLINLDDTEKDLAYVKQLPDYDRPDGGIRDVTNITNNAALLSLGGAAAASNNHTGASPKRLPVKKNYTLDVGDDTPHSSNSTPTRRAHSLAVSSATQRRWHPPIVGMLPPDFLRIAPVPGQPGQDFELPDEQFALMLQNEEFMNQLRWNQDFMNALEKEQSGKNKIETDIAFKERLRNMGQLSRKKFSQMARVFTWQRNKKVTTAKQIDSQPLREEPSDDEDHHHNHHRQQQKQAQQDAQRDQSPLRK